MSLEDRTPASGTTTPPESLSPAAQNQPEPPRPYEVSTEKAFLEAIKPIPIVGPWLVVVFRKWGWHGLLLVLGGFIAGAILMTSLFVFSIMPPWAVPEKYKKPAFPSAGSEPVSSGPIFTPHGDLPIMEVPDENKWQFWINDYKLRLQYETNRFEVNENRRTNVLALKDAFGQGTAEFTWRLDVDADHISVFARGFRVTNTGLIYPLNDTEANNPTHFKVPACTKGDVLVAIVLTITRSGSQDRPPVFQSSAP